MEGESLDGIAEYFYTLIFAINEHIMPSLDFEFAESLVNTLNTIFDILIKRVSEDGNT